MRVIAMYLPQFHRVEENDEWWGEGYTEWTAVRAAEPLFAGHNQPRVPMNNRYYDLMEKDTMQWQAELMKKYHVYGMCFYHYWFKEGRRILERPAENLLRWKEIDMPFCFSWANISWIRTWKKLQNGFTWSSKFEKHEEEKKKNGILLEQRYGGKEAWYQHFMYLLPFFLDERYIRMENKPVFIFYRPNVIRCLPAMMEYWNQLAHMNGLDGIYYIGTDIEECEGVDGILQLEPTYARVHHEVHETQQGQLVKIDYREIWNRILDRPVNRKYKTYLSGFTDFDTTPRQGDNGSVITGADPELFRENLKSLLKKSAMLGNEYVFINAWNEWGEGMYLEPDEKNRYAYLEAVRDALDTYEDASVQIKKRVVDYEKMVSDLKEREKRYVSYWRIFDKWFSLRENGKDLSSVMQDRGMKKVAVYGIGMLGRHLIEELKDSSVSVLYGIDRRNEVLQKEYPFPVYHVQEETLPEADAVVVTVAHQFYEIYQMLRQKIDCPIISLEELLQEDE